MRKGLTEVVFILDRSGSMRGLEQDTIGGFNSLIEKQQKEEGDALISTVLFDDRDELLYDRVDVQKIEPMNDRQYYVRGCTALLDAVGNAVERIETIHKYAREEDCPEKTMFIITTDGMENASRKFSAEQVKKLVEKHKKAGWEFIFLGANIDAVETAGRFGIGAERAINYECDRVGTRTNFESLSKAIGGFRKARSSAEMDCAFMEAMAPVTAHYEEKHAKKD